MKFSPKMIALVVVGLVVLYLLFKGVSRYASSSSASVPMTCTCSAPAAMPPAPVAVPTPVTNDQDALSVMQGSSLGN